MNGRLEVIVFVAGAVVMIVELVGSRILAPFLGTSLFTWTSLIGVILGSLSIGYWYGGKLADRSPNYKTFAWILFISALSVALIGLVQMPVLNVIQRFLHDVRVGSIAATVLLFAVPSTLLGMVSPYAVRLKIESLASSGTAVGRLYAISTAGSIVGTFAAGFFLIPFFGSVRIIFLLAGTLVLLSALARGGAMRKSATVALVLICACGLFIQKVGFLQQDCLLDADTSYYRAIVYEGTHDATGRPVRCMSTDAQTDQSCMFLDRDDELVLDYVRFYRLVGHFRPDVQNALMIGGGAYSYPREFLKTFPRAKMDVVEIDPEITRLAKVYFKLAEDARMRTYHEDGRTFLNGTGERYDAIFVDAFRSLTPPHHIATVEAIRRMHERLTDGGVVLVNINSSVAGDTGRFLRAELRTYQALFPQVYLFPVQKADNPLEFQNILLVAVKGTRRVELKSSEPEMNRYLSHLWTKDISRDVPALTDDYAPVDYYLMKAMQTTWN